MVTAWEATAAYLYVLRLDRLSLAWEYLRRNPQYRQHWRQRITNQDDAAQWGCATVEDPDLDARDASPEWLVQSPDLVSVMHIEQRHADLRVDHLFSLWNVAGQRVLSHTGTHLQLHARSLSSCRHVRIDLQLADGEPYAFVVRADGLLRERMRVIAAVSEEFKPPRNRRNLIKRRPVNRAALIHARTLQALDGMQVGASHRDIATALFGASRVKEGWTSDSELRAQVRYLIRRGKTLMNGGYRSLLLPATDVTQGES